MEVGHQALGICWSHLTSTIQPFWPIYQAHNIGLWPEQQNPGVAVFPKGFSDMSGYSWFYGSSMPMPCWTMFLNQEW
jgi:hypothetical protein